MPGEETKDAGLAELVEDDDGNRRSKAAQQHQAALTDAVLWSTITAQRRQRSGGPGACPTSGSTFQQRSQRLPGAVVTHAPISGTSGSVKAPSGAGPSRTVPAEVMHSSARSISRAIPITRSGQNSSPAAGRLEPSRLALRSSSSAPV